MLIILGRELMKGSIIYEINILIFNIIILVKDVPQKIQSAP